MLSCLPLKFFIFLIICVLKTEFKYFSLDQLLFAQGWARSCSIVKKWIFTSVSIHTWLGSQARFCPKREKEVITHQSAVLCLSLNLNQGTNKVPEHVQEMTYDYVLMLAFKMSAPSSKRKIKRSEIINEYPYFAFNIVQLI